MKIAWLSPFPPIKSGISVYSEELVNYFNFNFSNKIDIDKITIEKNKFIKSIDEINIKNYDKIVYSIGNHPIHKKIYNIMLRYPGIVFIHDINIHDLIYYLNRFNKVRYVNYLLNENNIEEEDIKKLIRGKDSILFQKYNMIKQTILKNYGFIVHTKNTFNIIKSINSSKDVFLLKHISVWHKFKQLDLKKNTIRIGVFGYMSKNRQIDRILEIIKGFNKKSIKEYKIIFVGEDADIELEKIINKTNTNNICEVYRNINDNRFLELMQTCDIGINIKYPYYGEMSSNIIKFMGFGIPVIVNECAFTDIPNNTVYKIKMNNFENEFYSILNLLENSDKIFYNINKNAYNYITEYHSIEKNANELIDFILNTKNKYIKNIKNFPIRKKLQFFNNKEKLKYLLRGRI